jgi:class 3 adenylate cyclase
VLDDYVEVAFTIAPQVREIQAHHPEKLSVEDYYFKYSVSSLAFLPPETGAPPGTPYSQGIRQFSKILAYIEPGQKKEFELNLEPGSLNGTDRNHHAAPQYEIRPGGPAKLQVRLSNGRYEPARGSIAAGRSVLQIENTGTQRAALLMVHLPAGFEPKHAVFDPFLSGNRLLSTQTFRDLFRSEVIRGSQGLNVRDIAVLFTDLKGSTALYDRIGDLKAFELVQQHFDALAKVIQKHSGALVKTIGDAVMATFLSPADASRAAVEMLQEIEAFNRGRPAKELMLKVGVHRGASIAVTLNDRLDYFGQTVNIASRVQGLADAEEVFVTHEVYAHPGVAPVFEGYDVKPERAKLRGVQEEMQVYKIARRK